LDHELLNPGPSALGVFLCKNLLKSPKFLLKTPKKYDKLDMLSRHKERSYRETAGNQPKSLVLIVRFCLLYRGKTHITPYRGVECWTPSKQQLKIKGKE
jgi:hypothetical protein